MMRDNPNQTWADTHDFNVHCPGLIDRFLYPRNASQRMRPAPMVPSVYPYQLLPLCRPAIERGEKVKATLPIRNVNRVAGTITGSELTRQRGAAGVEERQARHAGIP